jgi:phospholipid/cholesterol/gamma-HCH transport system substrate-binding protein
MKNNQENFKFRLGLFVSGGIFLFVAAIFIIGKQVNMFDSVFKVTATFYNVNGLQVGNNVRFSGINVGTVDNIKIVNDSTIEVSMLIKKSVKEFIKIDSEVSISSEGVIGDKLLNISQGGKDSPSVEDGLELASTEPLDTDAMMESVEISVLNVEIITKEFSDMLIGINQGKGTIGKLMNDKKMAENVSNTMKNLESSSKGLDENMDAAKENVLLRGYFKRKKRDALKKKKALEKEKNAKK